MPRVLCESRASDGLQRGVHRAREQARPAEKVSAQLGKLWPPAGSALALPGLQAPLEQPNDARERSWRAACKQSRAPPSSGCMQLTSEMNMNEHAQTIESSDATQLEAQEQPCRLVIEVPTEIQAGLQSRVAADCQCGPGGNCCH